MPSQEATDDECAIESSSSMEDLMDTTADDHSKIRTTSNSVYQTPSGSPTKAGGMEAFLNGHYFEQTVKAEAHSSLAAGQASKPVYDGNGWGRDDDYKSESGSVIFHPNTIVKEELTDTPPGISENSQIETDVVDFAYKKEDGDDRSTTSSMTEVNVPTTRKASKSSASDKPSETGSEVVPPSLRQNFKFPSEENEIIHKERKPKKERQINLDAEVTDENTSGTDVTNRLSYQSSHFSFRSSRFSTQGASQLTPTVELPPKHATSLSDLQIGPASYLEPLKYKMEPRQEPRAVAPRVRPRQDSLENNPYHEYMQAGTPMKKKVEKFGVSIDPQDVVYYMEQCQLVLSFPSMTSLH
jgi:hypothetical protein